MGALAKNIYLKLAPNVPTLEAVRGFSGQSGLSTLPP